MRRSLSLGHVYPLATIRDTTFKGSSNPTAVVMLDPGTSRDVHTDVGKPATPLNGTEVKKSKPFQLLRLREASNIREKL